MKQVNEVIEVLKALGYEPKHNEEKQDVYFTSFGSDAFPERHKKVVRALLGKQLKEFYYGGINTQHIYYRAVS
jgi:hypothetical protein